MKKFFSYFFKCFSYYLLFKIRTFLIIFYNDVKQFIQVILFFIIFFNFL